MAEYKGRDVIFLVCMDKDYKNIKRMYKIPTSDIDNIQGIQIYNKPSRYSKWERYRLSDEGSI